MKEVVLALLRSPSALSLAPVVLMIFVGSTWSVDQIAEQIVARAIEAQGGSLYEETSIAFSFRGGRYTIDRQEGRRRIRRSFSDSTGRLVSDVMIGGHVSRHSDGNRVDLPDRQQRSIASQLNSVSYFALLPYKLNDPAVRKRYLGETQIKDVAYHKIDVGFREEGGGQDWQDRFVYWFRKDDATIDYLAYYYHVNGGGLRFRAAFNKRRVGGLLLADYHNYKAADGIEDPAACDRLYEEGRLEQVSEIVLSDVSVTSPGN